MVCNYLRLLDEKYLDERNKFMSSIKRIFMTRNNTPEWLADVSLFYDILLSDDEVKRFHVDKALFKPRTIDAIAIQQAESQMKSMNYNWRKVTDYYERNRIDELLAFCPDEQGKALLADSILREAKQINGDDCIEAVKYIESLNLILHTGQTEKDVVANNQDTIIKELEAKLKQVTAEKEALEKQVEEYRNQPQASEVQKERNDGWTVELLAHLCFENEQVAKSILDDIRGKEDSVIADIILERKQRNQISRKTQNRELWKILHAAKLYRSTESNFNIALSRRQQR